MKSIKKFICLVIIALFAFVGMSASVSAYDKTITFHKRSLNGVSQYSGATTSYKTVDTSAGSRIGFCFNKAKSAPAEGSKLSFDKDITSAPLVYILENGYGGKWNTSLLGSGLSNDQKYYVTQLAIWMTQGSVSPSSINSTGSIGKPALALYNAAKKYTFTKANVSLTSGGTMTLSGSNYVSSYITLGGAGYDKATVTIVNAPADAKIEVKGSSSLVASGTKIAKGSQFRIVVPADKVGTGLNITIKASTTTSTPNIYRYTSGNSSYQNIGLLFYETKTLNASTTTSVTPKGSLKIVKVDNSTGTEVKLAGVKLTVKNASGAVVATWTTDANNNPYEIKDLPLGTYTVIEESAPAGYVKSSNITVSTKAGQTVEVKVVNTKNPSKVKISKQDITTKAELAGAHLVLKDSMGNKVDEWTSTTTPHYIQTLAAGTYTLSETIAPEGYLQTTETVTFTVEKDGGVEKHVVMYNTPIPDNTVITISKQDIATSKELPGATLVIKDANGKVVAQWVSTTTPHVIANLPIGKYTLIETKAPKGYGISDEIIEFEIKADGVQKKVVMYNSVIPVTADMNITLIVTCLIGTVGLAGFSMFKLNRQGA